MQLSKERIKDEMTHCPKFSNVFHKCSDYLQKLFFELAMAVSEYSCNKKVM